MAQEIFERYEKKYLLTEAQYLGLKRVFEDRMAADAYGGHDDKINIDSLIDYMEPGWLQKLCENHWFINTPNKFDKTDNVVYNK